MLEAVSRTFFAHFNSRQSNNDCVGSIIGARLGVALVGQLIIEVIPIDPLDIIDYHILCCTLLARYLNT